MTAYKTYEELLKYDASPKKNHPEVQWLINESVN